MGSAVGDSSTLAGTRTGFRHLATLRAENAQLRLLLAETGLAAQAEAQSAAARYRDNLATGAARLASSEALNARLRASEELNRRILWSTSDCVKVLDLDGRLVTVSDNCPAILGASSVPGLAGRSWVEFWHGSEGRASVLAALDAARAGRPSRFQAAFEIDAEIGTATTWWDIVVTPIDDGHGRPERILAVSRDITELKQNEARQTLLMQEMAHRVKNTLAIVQAVATQTLRNAASLDDAAEALGARLQALARAHDVLMQGSWSSAALRGIVEGAVRLHGDGEPGRFVVEGPDVTLGPRPALTLALMLHELGTNAGKYGALSNEAGHVAITWAIAPLDGADHLRFRWEEIGGPPVAPPARTGFGSRLIERSLIHGFGGTARLAYPETGVVLTMEAPLAAVVAEPPAS